MKANTSEITFSQCILTEPDNTYTKFIINLLVKMLNGSIQDISCKINVFFQLTEFKNMLLILIAVLVILPIVCVIVCCLIYKLIKRKYYNKYVRVNFA